MATSSCSNQDIQDLFLHISEVPPLTPPPYRSELNSATQDKNEGLLVALEGPVGGSLAFTLFPALGQDPVEQTRGSVRLGLGGHRLRQRDLGPPHRDGALAITLAPIQSHLSSSTSTSSSAPPLERLQNVSTSTFTAQTYITVPGRDSQRYTPTKAFGRQIRLAQLHHTGGGEVALLAVLQPPKPPLLLMFGQHQDDVTRRQHQLIWPVGSVAVHHYHLFSFCSVSIPPLWGKDSGEDFKVLIAVHVDALHLEDLTLAH